MFPGGWKGKTGAILAALVGIINALLPEHSAEITTRLNGLTAAFAGLSIYGITSALKGVSLAGKLGPVILAAGGLLKVLFPAQSAIIDTLLNALVALGGGMGLFGARVAVSGVVPGR